MTSKQPKDFENKIVELLKDKKNLSDSSIIVYLRNLKKLNNDTPFKNFDFLKDEKKIIEKLSQYKENTKRNYLISIVSVLSLFPDTKTKKLHDVYYKLMMDKTNEIKKDVNPEDLTKKQEENWMSWDQVLEVYKKLEEEVNKFIDTKSLTDAQYNKLISYVILSLYVKLEPRRNKDYQLMYVVKSYNKENMDKNYNYLDISHKKFIFNNYKTSKKYGSKEISIPDELFTIILKYLKHHPLLQKDKLTDTMMVPFLVNMSGSALDKVNSITRVLNRTFGKAIGSSMLRHIFLTGQFGPILEAQKKIAGNMAHSLNQQRDYIKVPKKIVVDF